MIMTLFSLALCWRDTVVVMSIERCQLDRANPVNSIADPVKVNTLVPSRISDESRPNLVNLARVGFGFIWWRITHAIYYRFSQESIKRHDVKVATIGKKICLSRTGHGIL